MNVMPKFVAAIVRPGDEAARRHEQAELVQSHLSSRLRAGFELDEMLEEIAILERVILRAWSTAPAESRLDVGGLDRLVADLHAAGITITRAFAEYLQEDEQTEKRYLRVLYESFNEPLDGLLPLGPERLHRALAIVMEATGADTAALLLHDAKTGELVMSASVGAVEEPFARYARRVDESSFVGTIASRAEPTAMRDVETSALEVPDELRHSGIHAVLGIRLPQQRMLLGVIYVGMRATRTFSAREIRRIEAIGEGLALHLDNARLYAEVLERIEALRAERALRSQFVAVLAHDLRGPLAAARMAAMLLDDPKAAGSPDQKKRVAIVLRNLDRADRMVADLLDVEQIHAGKRLPLALAEHDLGAIARDVANELSADHPGRVVTRVDEEVRGVWDGAVLRRAIWNLVANALKYGATDVPVDVCVAYRNDGVEVAVHNEGTPIPEDKQATLFEPFTRAASAGTAGWGLGLTLVRGAAESHGGSIGLDSAPGRGTTFTLRLPRAAGPALRAA
ncbi:Sensor histidine kinase [Minicystis rosea]|nr:Sensor histidine kinase [Minicystis rosea]